MFITTDQLKLHVELNGKGLPLLCIHGFPLSGELWAPLRDSLSDRYQLIIPDLRGHGQSGVSETVTMSDFADDLNAMLVAIDINRPVVVIGLSMGGYVAFEFYRRYRKRVQALVLVDTRANADTEDVLKGRREMSKRVMQEGSTIVADAMIEKLFAPDATEALKKKWHKIMAATDPKGVTAALGAMGARQESFSTLRESDVPALIVVGEKDVITPVDSAKKMHETARDSHLEIIPGAGHMVPVEAPDAFAKILEKFLSPISQA